MSARGLLAGTFLGIGALLLTSTGTQAAAAVPVPRVAAAPVPVTALKCDGDTYKCTANLQYGDGKWVADWNVNVYHQATTAATVTPTRALAAPVPVTTLKCDGDTYKCTANLQYGDGKWAADWNVNVYHQATTAATAPGAVPAAAPAPAPGAVPAATPTRALAAPVPVTTLKCDGDTYKCTANLQYGDGKWAADWAVNVHHL